MSLDQLVKFCPAIGHVSKVASSGFGCERGELTSGESRDFFYCKEFAIGEFAFPFRNATQLYLRDAGDLTSLEGNAFQFETGQHRLGIGTHKNTAPRYYTTI